LQLLEIVIWPLVALAGILFLSSRRGAKFIRAILRHTRRIKAFGVELELGDEEEARRLKVDLEKNFREYRDDVAVEFDLQAKRFDVARLLACVAEEVIEPAIDPQDDDRYRCTVYVEDIVFEDALYRLLNYYPGGDGKGKTFPTRFGIIGRSWRLARSEGPTKVPHDREELITTWGMTREEAASQLTSKWYMTFLLGKGRTDPAVGLLFVEADSEIPQSLMEELADAETESVKSLTRSVASVMENIRDRGPYLELFDN
jgi:hypothetical protein